MLLTNGRNQRNESTPLFYKLNQVILNSILYDNFRQFSLANLTTLIINHFHIILIAIHFNFLYLRSYPISQAVNMYVSLCAFTFARIDQKFIFLFISITKPAPHCIVSHMTVILYLGLFD